MSTFSLGPFVRFSIFTLTIAALSGATDVAAVPPPGQPASGPGGSDYPHASVTVRSFGKGGDCCWMFLPADPQPKSAPVVVFVHGWGGINPGTYGAWIRHLARRGYIVIYPQYQDSMATRLPEMIPNAVTATRKALELLSREGPVKPAAGGIAYVAHSIGGYISANMAAMGGSDGLPPCKAILVTAPANGSTTMHNEKRLMKLEHLDRIPADALMVAAFAENDRLAKDVGSRDILAGATHVSPANKTLVMVQTDDHTDPALTADHFSPCAPDPSLVPGNLEKEALAVEDGPESAPAEETKGRGRGEGRGGRFRERIRERVAEKRGGAGKVPGESERAVTNTLDYYGYWKLGDGMLDAAFHGKNREYAFGRGKELTNMGTCSDGSPVKPLIVKTLQ